MGDEFAVPFPGGTARVLEPSDVRKLEAWPRAFEGKYKDARYYALIDETLSGDFDFRYLVLEDTDGKVRAIQSAFFVRQNLVEGVRGIVRTMVDGLRKKFPRFLTMRVLMIGCAAGAGELSTIAPEDKPWVARALGPVLRDYARASKASLVVFKDFLAKEREILRVLRQQGYVRAPSMPMTRLAISFRDFDEYLARLGHASRKNLRRKFRKTESAARIDMQVLGDVRETIDQIYPLYLQVHERSPMKFERLTRDFFLRVAKEMPERARFFVWRIGNRIVAFSFAFLFENTLYDEVIGLDYDVALDLHLYFYTMRDVIRWAIDHNIREYVSGPLNYDPKLHLGHELLPLDLYVQHTNSFLNPIFKFALKYLEPTRHDPVLRKFPNADQL